MTKHTASQCLCTYPNCKDWHVEPVAAVQGVHFTQPQAEAVAALLNNDKVCPFCNEGDFDLPGLKAHLYFGWCLAYKNTDLS